MNHIYKTIFNKNTGRIDVVSENASCSSRSKKTSPSQTQVSGINTKKRIPPTTTKINYMCLLISLIISTPVIASTDYDGTSSILTNSTTISGDFDKLLSTQNVDGVFDQNTKEVNIDYTIGMTPNFVIAGYDFVDTNNTTQTKSSSDNIINLKQGDINGPIYSGLVHGSIIEKSDINSPSIIEITDEINNKTLDANNNRINILNTDPIQVSGGIFSGYTGIKINFGDLNSANTNTNTNTNIMNANQNTTSTNGDNNSFNDISAGYTGININYSDLKVVNAIADANTNTNTNIMNANQNTTSIKGDNNSFNDISAGYTGININYGDLNTPAIYANTDSEANSNIMNANQNTTSIKGDNNSFNDISAGYAGININNQVNRINKDNQIDQTFEYIVNTNTISSNKNNILITGSNNTFTNLTAGNSIFNIDAGQFTMSRDWGNGVIEPLNSTLDMNTNNTKLYANDNEISLAGSSTISGDIKTGSIDFTLKYNQIELAGPSTGTIDIINNRTGTEAYANNNKINIVGAHQFTNPNSLIYGGSLNINNPDYKPETYDVFTGNTLNYNNILPINIKEIGNFQTYNFTLNPAFANTNTALITAQTVNLGTNEANSSNYLTTPVSSDIYVVGIQSGQLVQTDSQFILMQAAAGQLTGEGTGHSSKGVAQQGISLLYDVETKVDQTKDQVIAVINSSYEPSVGPTVNPQLKALLEGNLSGLMLLSRGADHLSDNLFSAITEQNTQRGLTPFVIFSGNHSKYDTGSYIKSNGGLFTVGLSIQDDQWLAGAFIENGWDSYKTMNDFTNAGEVRGKGHNKFNGVGLYGHYDFLNGWYADTTLRGGRIHTAFRTDDIQNISTGERVSYDLSHNYYGMNLEGGYKFVWDEKNTLDLNTKYLWATTSAKSMQIADDPIHFDKLTSQRIQLNAENNYQLNPEMSILTGLGYEYEFDGKAKGTTYDIYDIDQASVKGSTGVATVGLRYEPKAYDRFSMDLKGSGYFGKREGGAAMLKMDYKF